ncbi:MAG TPA: hypothetical protein VF669_08855 [Tepidisphaeraceae bacterium]
MNPLQNQPSPAAESSVSPAVRAALAARKLAQAKGAAFYVVRNGRLVNLNAQANRRRRVA